jgi:hypothetical protein
MKEKVLLLNSLKNRCKRFRNIIDGRHSVFQFQSYERQFLDILNDLKIKLPDLFSNFQPSEYRENVRIGSYDMKAVNDLINDIQYCIEILAGVDEIYKQEIEVTKQGIFFQGTTFDALMKITNLVKFAENEIILIDGYVDENILKLLTSKNQKVNVKILTKEKSFKSVLPFVDAFNKQYKNLEVKASEVYHDRFLIIDQKDVYHFGASLKDAGNRVFMFSKIEDEAIIKTLFESFKTEW